MQSNQTHNQLAVSESGRNSSLIRLNLRHLIFSCIAIVLTGNLPAQDSSVHVLSLDEAIRMAVTNNRSLMIANLEVDRTKWEIAETKTKRLPAFNASVLGSQLLNEISYTFKQGDFGIY